MVEVAVLKARIDEKDRALSIQAKEYERRLEDLNNAHARAERVLGTYVPREILIAEVSILNKKIETLMEYRQNTIGRFGAISDIWGWFVGIIGIVVAFLAIWWK